MLLSVTLILMVTLCPRPSIKTAVQFAGFPFAPAFTAVAVNDVALCPGPGASVTQFPPADGSSVVLHVSLWSVNVAAAPVALGVSVAVSFCAVN